MDQVPSTQPTFTTLTPNCHQTAPLSLHSQKTATNPPPLTALTPNCHQPTPSHCAHTKLPPTRHLSLRSHQTATNPPPLTALTPNCHQPNPLSLHSYKSATIPTPTHCTHPKLPPTQSPLTALIQICHHPNPLSLHSHQTATNPPSHYTHTKLPPTHPLSLHSHQTATNPPTLTTLTPNCHPQAELELTSPFFIQVKYNVCYEYYVRPSVPRYQRLNCFSFFHETQYSNSVTIPIPVAARSKAWVCGHLLVGLWVRIPPGTWMYVCCEGCLLLGRGLCDGLITRPEESY